jgi:hypothetical protein
MSERFIDGIPVPPGYEAAVTKALNDCCDAEEMFDLDELERHSAELKRKAEEDARRDLDEARANHPRT